MADLQSNQTIPGIKKTGGKFSHRSTSEVAKFNMAAFDLERMDAALRNAHDKLREAHDLPLLRNLEGAFEDTRHAFLILKYAYQAEHRKELGKQEMRIKMELSKLREVSENRGKGGITYTEANAIMSLIWDFLDGIYKAKQESGIGIPKNKYMGAEAKIRAAVKA